MCITKSKTFSQLATYLSIFLAVCLGTPAVDNATVDWDPSLTYTVQAFVTATCNPSHLFEESVASQVVTCNNTGWESVPGCYPACTQDPPLAGENMEQLAYNFCGVGGVVRYNCSPGFHLKYDGEVMWFYQLNMLRY